MEHQPNTPLPTKNPNHRPVPSTTAAKNPQTPPPLQVPQASSPRWWHRNWGFRRVVPTPHRAVRVSVRLFQDVEGEADCHPRAVIPALRAAYNVTVMDREGTTKGQEEQEGSPLPDHIDFYNEVSTAARLNDDVLLLVNVVEGILHPDPHHPPLEGEKARKVKTEKTRIREREIKGVCYTIR